MSEKIISISRIALLLGLAFICFCGLVSVPLDDSPTWGFDLLVSKVIGFGAGYAFYRLETLWAKTDKWLMAYERWSAKGFEDDEEL